MKTLILKPGREKSLRRRHPWIFSGAVNVVQGNPAAGETVLIRDAAGSALAVGAYSPASQIRCRVWSFDPEQPVDAEFFRQRLSAAIDRRRAAGFDLQPSGACRLCYSESDGLPGLIVDVYAGTLVCQILSAGAEYWKDTLAGLLQELLPGRAVYERSDVEVRHKEGLAQRSGLISGEEPPERIVIEENNISYQVDVRHGHKTGFYLDQRDNRRRVQDFAGGEVLNCFSYSGGFAFAALAAGAERAVNIDSSAATLAMIEDNARLNDIDPSRMDNIEANVFEQLRAFRRAGRQFDLVVLDPPKFVESRQAMNRGARAYKDVNMQAIALLRPGGTLMTFSCSGLLPAPLFQKIVADAALDVEREGWILASLGQSADHPVALNFPEAEYLKGYCVRVG